MQSIDIELWFIVNESPYDASIIDEVTHKPRLKIRNELISDDRTHLTLNAKVMNVLYSSLDSNKSIRVKGCRSAETIWDKLRKIHEMWENKRNLV